jgi:hypothetical protein
MDPASLQSLLKALHDRRITVAQAHQQLRDLPFHDMGFAKIDHHRAIRTGRPEVIFCQGKTLDQVVDIVQEQVEHGETVLGTRANSDVLSAVQEKFPKAGVSEPGRCFWIKSPSWRKKRGKRGGIVIATAGTADIPVAEEARCTVEIMGYGCTALHDIGVSGIHRLFAHRETLQKAAVIIVIAGMEGALPSVVAGMVAKPVIGVPTSVGYGSHLDGLVPLFAMLNSCATGLTVVNIDNGFGAACAAITMLGS